MVHSFTVSQYITLQDVKKQIKQHIIFSHDKYKKKKTKTSYV